MTTNEKVSELIIKVKKTKMPPGGLKPEANLRDDLGLDSLALSELLVLVEDAFKISVSMEEVLNVQTLAEIVACVDKHRAA